jgi:CRP-like cAMP-binding protein
MASPRAEEIKRLPLFAGLGDQDRELLATSLDEMDAPAGAVLIREGAGNHAFFIIREGEAEVTVGGQRRRICSPGDFFGEISMQARVPATATVVTRTPVKLYVMSHAQFRVLGTGSPVVGRLTAAMEEHLRADRSAADPSGD